MKTWLFALDDPGADFARPVLDEHLPVGLARRGSRSRTSITHCGQSESVSRGKPELREGALFLLQQRRRRPTGLKRLVGNNPVDGGDGVPDERGGRRHGPTPERCNVHGDSVPNGTGTKFFREGLHDRCDGSWIIGAVFGRVKPRPGPSFVGRRRNAAALMRWPYSVGDMIQLNEVVKRFDGKREVTALKGVSLRIDQGEMVSIVGPSGSGKSTLLNIMGCLDRPTSGDVSIGGQRLDAMGDDDLTRVRRDKIGFVFQFFNLLATLTAKENVALPLHLRGWSAAQGRTSARRNCWTWWAWASASTICPRSCRAESGSASRLPARCRSTRPSCSATSRRATSIRRREPRS